MNFLPIFYLLVENTLERVCESLLFYSMFDPHYYFFLFWDCRNRKKIKMEIHVKDIPGKCLTNNLIRKVYFAHFFLQYYINKVYYLEFYMMTKFFVSFIEIQRMCIFSFNLEKKNCSILCIDKKCYFIDIHYTFGCYDTN